MFIFMPIMLLTLSPGNVFFENCDSWFWEKIASFKRVFPLDFFCLSENQNLLNLTKKGNYIFHKILNNHYFFF